MEKWQKRLVYLLAALTAMFLFLHTGIGADAGEWEGGPEHMVIVNEDFDQQEIPAGWGNRNWFNDPESVYKSYAYTIRYTEDSAELSSPPLDLRGMTDLVLRFQYINDSSDVYAEVSYFLPETGEKQKLQVLPGGTTDWKQAECCIPEEACKENVQIVFSVSSGPAESNCMVGIDNVRLEARTRQITLRYEANGGFGCMQEESGYRPIRTKLPENSFDAPHDPLGIIWVFGGWNTEPDGSGTSYQPGDYAEFWEDTTLYAQWREKGLLEEDFEGGWLPEGWTAENVSPGCQWTNGREDEDSEAGAHGGSGYASIYEIETDGAQSMLITPFLNLNTSGKSAVLRFWYLNRQWDPVAGEFGVFYRVNRGEWQELYCYHEHHDEWTMDMVCLPEEACRDGVQIGFRGGWGAALDDAALIISDPVDLSYDANGGSGNRQDQSSNAQAGFVIKDNGFGAPYDSDAVFCVFTGWNTKADGSGTSYQPGSFAEFAEPTILYAQWESRDSFEEDFDDGKADGWTFADADGDGNGWSAAEGVKAYSGTGALTSASYDLGQLHPDNWAFTPLLNVPENAQLTFRIAGQDNEEDYAEEKMELYAGESPDPEGMVQIGEGYISQADYIQYTVDLSDYAGKKYFAFRHLHSADRLSALNLDDVAMTVKPKEDPEVVSHSLLLSGEIGVNFYVRLPGRISDYENSYMLFTVGGEEKEPVYLNENFKNSSGTAYGFACYVNSLQMAEKITAAFCFGEDGSERIVDEYSVLDYVNYIIEHPDDYQEVLALARSISDYGYYAQQYLSGIHGFSLVKGEGYAPVPGSYITYTGTDFTEAAQKLQKYACSFENPSDGAERPFSSMTYSLAFDAQTEIRIYFRLKEEAETACSIRNAYGGAWENGGMSLRSDGRYMISIKNIPAHKLGEMFQVTISVGETEYRLTVSALSYASTVLGNAGLSDSEKAAMCALFHYYNCAVEYKQT